MAIIFVTTGAWGTGTGTPNSAAQVDGNFYDVDQRIVDLVADVAEGKRIDFVTYTDNSMTFHFTDATTQIIPLPVATLEFVGEWTNDMPLQRGQMISAGDGFYQVLESHVTPAAPAVFDPNATDETTDQNPLYQLFLFVHSIPAEGETGQFLRKVSATDYDVEWAAASAGAVDVEDTGSTTIDPVLDDAGKYFRCTSTTDITVTIPLHASIAFPVGTELKFRQCSTGTIVLEGEGAVVLNSIDGYLTESGAEGAVVEAIKISNDEWDVFGLLAAVTA